MTRIADGPEPRTGGADGVPQPPLSRWERMRRSSRPAIVGTMVAGAFLAGLTIGDGLPGDGGVAHADSSLTGLAEFETLQDTWDLIHSEWPEPDEIDDAALIYGAARGMVDAVGDEGHSTFLDPVESAEYQRASNGEFVGIGVEVDSRCGVPVVMHTMEGSPAEAAGILPGDIIVQVDDVSTERATVQRLRELVLGSEGDQLTLTVERQGEPTPLTFEIVRRVIESDPVTWRWLPDKTVQMRVTGFEVGVNREVRAALETIRAEGAERLILDLRGNPGGLVPEVIGVASQFLDEGKTIFEEKGRDAVAHPITTIGHDGHWLDLALIVLIDDQSASGAEVLAAALRDNGRARLIGETTFGTGTVLRTFPQEDGSSVVLGTAFWLTPEGEHIWGEGVTPDEPVTLARDAYPSRPEDDPELTVAELEALEDTQLQAAFDALGAPQAMHETQMEGPAEASGELDKSP